MKDLKKHTQEHVTQDAKKRLVDAARLSQTQLASEYGISDGGLTSEDVDKMRMKFGQNKITQKKKDSSIVRLLKAFGDPFTLVLFLLAFISFTTDFILAPEGQKDPSTFIIIMVLIYISGLLQFFQETRSLQAAQALSAMVKTTILVRRKAGDIELLIEDLVVGDLIVLSAGVMIPADLRIVSCTDLFVAQSSLTGESEPLEKIDQSIQDASQSPLDINNLAFMGSNVVSGSALGFVVNVGDATIFGSIAHDVQQAKPKTSFELGLNSVTWVLIRLMCIMVPIVFVAGGLRSNDWLGAFLFALSVAVGLTPAMLPTIVSTNLAKGAIALSKQKVIVKNIASIQNFGAIDVLCTDKTGTITKDEVQLMQALNVSGKQDDVVLKYGFLNSDNQTGLKNLMDVAIIKYASLHEDKNVWSNYQKVDEIPFDFSRRRMSVIVQSGQDPEILITKGAIEEMLSICTQSQQNGVIQDLDKKQKDDILALVQSYNKNGLRVLGLAYKKENVKPGSFGVEDENEMILLGFLTFLDPPKDSATQAMKALHDYGVRVKILTGDNDAVTHAVCKQVGMNVDKIMLGSQIEAMSDSQLDDIVEDVDVFAKLSPAQKARIIVSLKRKHHSVGYMGDGINDAPAMKQADVGISVDSAVDIAKETANIILLEKDLMVLQKGIVEGRKTYANIIKYIKMTLSSNFGNVCSILIASILLPFLPMLPIQLLVLNLIYDISCLAIPWDNVDEEFLRIPRAWDASSVSTFMIRIGPTSSIFDVSTFLAMYFWICPMVMNGNYASLSTSNQLLFAALFHTGWFMESLWTQTLVIHMIRTPKIPFIQSRASGAMLLFTSVGMLFGLLLPYSPLGPILGLEHLPIVFYLLLIVTIASYMVLITIVKKAYIKKYKELL